MITVTITALGVILCWAIFRAIFSKERAFKPWDKCLAFRMNYVDTHTSLDGMLTMRFWGYAYMQRTTWYGGTQRMWVSVWQDAGKFWRYTEYHLPGAPHILANCLRTPGEEVDREEFRWRRDHNAFTADGARRALAVQQ